MPDEVVVEMLNLFIRIKPKANGKRMTAKDIRATLAKKKMAVSESVVQKYRAKCDAVLGKQLEKLTLQLAIATEPVGRRRASPARVPTPAELWAASWKGPGARGVVADKLRSIGSRHVTRILFQFRNEVRSIRKAKVHLARDVSLTPPEA